MGRCDIERYANGTAPFPSLTHHLTTNTSLRTTYYQGLRAEHLHISRSNFNTCLPHTDNSSYVFDIFLWGELMQHMNTSQGHTIILPTPYTFHMILTSAPKIPFRYTVLDFHTHAQTHLTTTSYLDLITLYYSHPRGTLYEHHHFHIPQ